MLGFQEHAGTQVGDFGSARSATDEGYHWAEQDPPERARAAHFADAPGTPPCVLAPHLVCLALKMRAMRPHMERETSTRRGRFITASSLCKSMMAQAGMYSSVRHMLECARHRLTLQASSLNSVGTDDRRRMRTATRRRRGARRARRPCAAATPGPWTSRRASRRRPAAAAGTPPGAARRASEPAALAATPATFRCVWVRRCLLFMPSLNDSVDGGSCLLAVSCWHPVNGRARQCT